MEPCTFFKAGADGGYSTSNIFQLLCFFKIYPAHKKYQQNPRTFIEVVLFKQKNFKIHLSSKNIFRQSLFPYLPQFNRCKGRGNYEVIDTEFYPNVLTRNLSCLLKQEIQTKHKELIQPALKTGLVRWRVLVFSKLRQKAK